MSAQRRLIGAAMMLAIGLAYGAGCSSDAKSKTGKGGASGTAGASGSAGAGGSGTTTGTGGGDSGTGTGGMGTGGTGAGGNGSAACPSSQPAHSSACSSSITGYCYFATTICSCDPQGGATVDGGTAYTWNCGTAPAGCPQTVPAVNSACTQAGQKCSYDFRPCAANNPSTYSCEGGTWKFLIKPCS